ncbi:hypothetical protein [Brevibacillus thermoruber]|uniref:hypothetical protein n=1 Tax=Brevibacillus thermoruber TaxID=33942 RepID=UPI0005530F1A|nr:hypothetical protein [Brevibacillus thermoruber]
MIIRQFQKKVKRDWNSKGDSVTNDGTIGKRWARLMARLLFRYVKRMVLSLILSMIPLIVIVLLVTLTLDSMFNFTGGM